jgi:hypothetical protein
MDYKKLKRYLYSLTKDKTFVGRWSNKYPDCAREIQANLLEAIVELNKDTIYFKDLKEKFLKIVDWNLYGQEWVKEMTWGEIYYTLNEFNFIQMIDSRTSGFLYFDNKIFFRV